jgi:hypothetical protein
VCNCQRLVLGSKYGSANREGGLRELYKQPTEQWLFPIEEQIWASYYLCFTHTVGRGYQQNRYESNRILPSIEDMIDGYKGVESPVIKLYEQDHKSLLEIPTGDGSWGNRLERAVTRVIGPNIVQE